MKKLIYILLIMVVFSACNSSDGPSSSDSELQLNQAITGTISAEGEVDLYHIRVNEANTILTVSCTGNTAHPEVETLVTVYQDEVDENNRLLAGHAQEDSYLPADVNMNLFIDTPKDIYIAVRDFMDDEADPDQLYHLTVSTVESTEDNNDFSSAVAVSVDDPGSTATDRIDYIGDKDCFSFMVNEEGVYAVSIDFEPFIGGSSVKLAAQLFGPNGDLIDATTNISSNGFYFLAHLMTSIDSYHIVVEDYGNDDSDQSSQYSISVSSVAASEFFQNDTQGEATLLTDEGENTFSANAALDYNASSESVEHAGDQDWYSIPVGDISASGIKVLNVTMTDSDATQDRSYRISLMDETESVLLTHDYKGGATPYSCQVLAGTGVHYVQVQAAENTRLQESEAYEISVEVIDVDDPAEVGDGNNTETFATEITSGTPVDGKIAYRGDVDYYFIDVPTNTSKVLEVSLDSDASMVDYDVQIQLNTSTIKKIYDTNGSDGPVQLETSIFIQSNSSSTTRYYIRVADYTGDDGDAVPYNLAVNVESVPDGAGITTAPDGTYCYYFGEDEEIEMDSSRSTELELEVLYGEEPVLNADTSLMDFRAADLGALHITRTDNPDETVTFEMPWIAGYVDYQGDRDMFQLDLDALDAADTHWYYDIEIQLVTATGSTTDVEYNWKFYRDSNGNGIVMDNPGADDGYRACDGDMTLTTESIDITTPTGSDEFYVGDLWTDTPYYTVYIGISDYNYLNLPTSNPDSPTVNPDPDNDWGYDTPYYFKVRLTYHPGVSYP